MVLHNEQSEAFAAWLPQCRWFSAKNIPDFKRHIQSIDYIDISDHPEGGESLKLVVIRVEIGRGETTFLAPVLVHFNQHSIMECRDAATDPTMSKWLLDLIQSGRSLQTAAGTFVGHSVHQHEGQFSTIECTSALSENASNTSVFFTTRDAYENSVGYVSKLFRTYHIGIQPEVEVGLHLAQNGWVGAPPLVGWLEYIPTGEEQGGAVATVHEALTPTTDAWTYSIKTLLEDWHASDTLLCMATRVGILTAHMHTVLANSQSSPAFSPVTPSDEEKRENSHIMMDHAQSVWDLLSTASVPSPFQQRVRTVLTQQQRLMETLEAVAHLEQTAAYIRVHGDYHLGQLLIDQSHKTLHVIDFEGEPGRTLEERRRKTSIFKDLAGMSRSFEYLCHRTENRAPHVEAADLTRAFLKAYSDKANGQCFYPDTEGEAEKLLNAFMLDKAIYELAYEAQYRPDWLDTPLTAVENFLRTGCFLVV